jgi:hypothetical protein
LCEPEKFFGPIQVFCDLRIVHHLASPTSQQQSQFSDIYLRGAKGTRMMSVHIEEPSVSGMRSAYRRIDAFG